MAAPIPEVRQERTLEWVAISFSNAGKWKVKSESEVAQSSPTLHDPMDCSPPGSSVHGSFQARVLEWGAIAFSVSCAQVFINQWTISCQSPLSSKEYWRWQPIPSSGDLPNPEIEFTSPLLAGGFFIPGKPLVFFMDGGGNGYPGQ